MCPPNLNPLCPIHLQVGVVYVAHGQTTEHEILSNKGGSLAYLRFIQTLGQFVPLTDCTAVEYTGGLDRSGLDGAYAVRYDDELTQIIFHVATMIDPPESSGSTTAQGRYLARKRHIGNDGVKIVFTEQGDFEMETWRAKERSSSTKVTRAGSGSVQMKTASSGSVSASSRRSMPQDFGAGCSTCHST